MICRNFDQKFLRVASLNRFKVVKIGLFAVSGPDFIAKFVFPTPFAVKWLCLRQMFSFCLFKKLGLLKNVLIDKDNILQHEISLIGAISKMHFFEKIQTRSTVTKIYTKIVSCVYYDLQKFLRVASLN